MHWSAAYIGLPWQERGLTREGIACWGLARLVYAEVLNLDVPDYAAAVPSIQARAEVAAVFEGGVAAGPWLKIEPADPREFDILVFRRAGLEAHAGIVCGPGRMLHIDKGQDSHVIDYTTGRWAPRLAGVYRHEAMHTLIPALITARELPAGTLHVSRLVPARVVNRTTSQVDVQELPDGRGGRRFEVVIGTA